MKKKDAYRDAELGILVVLHKEFTAMHTRMAKAPPETGEQLLQHISHMDYLIDEVARLIPRLPDHKAMSIEQTEKLRFIAAAKHTRNFSIQQMQNIIAKNQNYINYKLAKRRKEDSNQVTD